MLIRNTVIEVQKVRQGPGAGLPGVDRIPDHTPGHVVQLVHLQGPGPHRLDLVHEVSTAIIHGVADHLHTLLLAVRTEDEPRGNLDPLGKDTLHIKGTAAVLKRHMAINISEAETNPHVRESIVKVGHL